MNQTHLHIQMKGLWQVRTLSVPKKIYMYTVANFSLMQIGTGNTNR